MQTSLFGPFSGAAFSKIIDTYASGGVRFFAPDVAFVDTEKYLPPLLKKRGKADVDVSAYLDYLRNLIEPVASVVYADFESESRLRLRGRDQNDWQVLATALALACGIWTEGVDFFGTGIAVWTTDRIEIFLKAEVQRLQSRE